MSSQKILFLPLLYSGDVWNKQQVKECKQQCLLNLPTYFWKMLAAAGSGLAPAVSSKFSSVEFLNNVPSSHPRLSVRRRNGCKQTSRNRVVNTVHITPRPCMVNTPVSACVKTNSLCLCVVSLSPLLALLATVSMSSSSWVWGFSPLLCLKWLTWLRLQVLLHINNSGTIE